MRKGLLVVIAIMVAPLANQSQLGAGGHALAARAQGGGDRRRFDNPRINGRAVDRCLNWGENCEQPAADNFCRLNGYAGADTYRFSPMHPTLVAGDDTVCDQDECQGFTTITCAGRGGRRFENPRINGRAVDRCLNWGENCEQPAADNFCRLNGYAGADTYRFSPMRPTLVAGDNTVCDQDGCQGFTTITCAGRGGRRFEDPRVNGRAVDRCLNWGENCEQPAADNFCRLNGYAGADTYRFSPMRPTLVVGDNRVCDEPACEGFTSIHCR